jgi:hypothetical protein
MSAASGFEAGFRLGRRRIVQLTGSCLLSVTPAIHRHAEARALKEKPHRGDSGRAKVALAP